MNKLSILLLFFVMFPVFIVQAEEQPLSLLKKAEACILEGKPSEAIDIYFQLGSYFFKHKKYQKAIACYSTALTLDPTIPSLIYNLAFALRLNGNYEDAAKMYEKALVHRPQHEDTYFGLANAYLALGDFEHGLPAFEKGRESTARVSSRLYSIATVAGKSIVIYEEWGVGDTFQFIRYAQTLKEAGASKVYVHCRPLLKSILSLCPYLDAAITSEKELQEKVDYKVPLMSLMHVCGTTLNSIPAQMPYLYADKNLVAEWGKKLASDTNFKIGINWRGTGTLGEKDAPAELFAQLTEMPNVSVYSLQYGWEQELKELQNNKIITFDADFDQSHGRFMDSAAVMKNLDLVITIDTSVAHLAAGLGVPTMVMLPYVADWRWLVNRTDTPWYPTMHLYRQPKPGDWLSVMTEITKAVLERIKSKQQLSYKELIQEAEIALEKKKFDNAITFYQQALKLQPNDIFALTNLGYTWYCKQGLDRSIEIFKQIAHIQPTDAQTFNNLGSLYREQRKMTEAIEAYSTALKLDPTFALAMRGLGYSYLTIGDLENAWKIWRTHDILEPENYKKTKPLWDGSISLKNKKLLIIDEGGFGDTFQWIRYAHYLKTQGAHIIFESRQSLLPLLALCPAIDTLISKNSPISDYDFYIPLGRLHCACNTTQETIPADIPYLHADEKLTNGYKELLKADTAYKIGICWAAQSYYDADTKDRISNTRSIPLQQLLSLHQIQGVSLYSLQKINGLKEIKKISNPKALKLFSPADFDTHNGAFMDTAAIIKNLNLIITADTSIAHLAGALGAKVWVLLPFVADWRWFLDRTDSPWYPTMRLFRQPKPGDWESVMQEVTQALHKIIKEGHS